MFLERKVDRRVPAINDDAGLGLITCVWDRTGQMARQSIPEWREAASVVSEVACEEKIGGNGVERTVNKDMTNDGKNLRHTNKSHLACERAQQEKVCAGAYNEVFSVHTPSRSWQLPLAGRETARKKNLRSVQDCEWRLDSGEFDNG